MAAACGITIVKRFTYRDDSTEEFSNTYWLTGTAPSTSADWRTLFNAIVLVEKTVYPSGVSVVRGYGYNDDTGHKPGDTGAVSPSVWTVDLTVSPETPVAGTNAGTAWAPGDAAVWVRWKTSRTTNPGGKPIYIRKYFHPALMAGTTSADHDEITPQQRTALGDLGTLMDDGSLPDARTITTCGQSDTILSHGVAPYITTRTLKRRGRRPGA